MNNWVKSYLKYKQFPHVSIEMFSMYPFLRSLKLFYIDNCLHVAVETFANKKELLPQFATNLENVQFYAFSLLFFLKGWQPRKWIEGQAKQIVHFLCCEVLNTDLEGIPCTLFSSGVMVAHLTPTLNFLMAWAQSTVTTIKWHILIQQEILLYST